MLKLNDLRKYLSNVSNYYVRMSVPSFKELLRLYNNDFKKQDTILRRFKSSDENLFIRHTLVSALFHLLVE